MPRIKKKRWFNSITLQIGTTSNLIVRRYFYLIKRTKIETPSKSYLRILEDTLKTGQTALYLLNTNALNTPSIISLLSQYNVDIPKYHRDVDKIRRNFKSLVQKTDFKVINYQEAYDNKGVFHIDVKPTRVVLGNNR